jgi:hypothetical protein
VIAGMLIVALVVVSIVTLIVRSGRATSERRSLQSYQHGIAALGAVSQRERRRRRSDERRAAAM